MKIWGPVKFPGQLTLFSSSQIGYSFQRNFSKNRKFRLARPASSSEISAQNPKKHEKQQGSTLSAKNFLKIRGSPKIARMVINQPEITF